MLLWLLLACRADTDAGGEALSREELMDPERCAGCHPDHYREWSGSMHAYAWVDPLVQGMIDLSGRELGEAQAAECAPCHAPMAEALGLTGEDAGELPPYASGVTCFWCHAAAVSDDLVLRGGIEDPMPTAAHASEWSPLHDRGEFASVDLCGSCHLETLYEWQPTLFAQEPGMLSCGGCHMDGRDGPAAAVEGAPERRVHGHGMPGLDLALTDFPEREAQLEGVLEELDTSLLAQLCVVPDDRTSAVQVTLENVSAGHRWPSASRDRRAWVELVATDEEGRVLWSTGAAADDQPLSALEDPDLWMIGLQMVDEAGQPVYLPWRSAGFEGETLPPPELSGDASHVVRGWRVHDASPARVRLRVRVRPVALDIGEALVASGDLDPSIAAALPTLEVEAAALEWTADMGSACVP